MRERYTSRVAGPVCRDQDHKDGVVREERSQKRCWTGRVRAAVRQHRGAGRRARRREGPEELLHDRWSRWKHRRPDRIGRHRAGQCGSRRDDRQGPGRAQAAHRPADPLHHQRRCRRGFCRRQREAGPGGLHDLHQRPGKPGGAPGDDRRRRLDSFARQRPAENGGGQAGVRQQCAAQRGVLHAAQSRSA